MATKQTHKTSFEPKRKLALVIGIGKYEHCAESPTAENDANDMASALENIGFIVTKRVHQTCEDMEYSIIAFKNSIQPKDIVLFYFTGHGTQWEDQNYLIPRDTPTLTGADLNSSAINAQEILHKLSTQKPFVIIFLLDCCRKYHLRNPHIDHRDRSADNPKSPGLAAMHKAGSLIAFSCAPGTINFDENAQRNSLFTKHLLQHITTKDEDIVTILCRVTKDVMEESRGKQIPFVSVSLSEKSIYLHAKGQTELSELDQPQDILNIAKKDLKLEEEIGRGGFGIVYRARWLSQRETVAVKRLHLQHLDERSERKFYQEVALMHNIHYPHIIALYGICLEYGWYAIVMEYMALGSLHKILHEDRISMDWPTRLSIAFQAAKGINYLHSQSPPIIHRNLNSLNILLKTFNNKYVVKVCDFGLTGARNETARQAFTTDAPLLRLQWTAPEVLLMEKHTRKSDVYSLGIVYWELASNEVPYDGYRDAVIREFVLSGERLDIPENTPPKFGKLIHLCWAGDPKDRPDCSKVIDTIEQCIENEKSRVPRQQSERPKSMAARDDDDDDDIVQTPPSIGNRFRDSSPRRVATVVIKKPSVNKVIPDLPADQQWEQQGVTVVGKKGWCGCNNQLNDPCGLFVDDEDDQIIVIADFSNHRIVQCKRDDTQGQVVAGGNGRGNRLDQLSSPTDVLIDKETNSFIIADQGNDRVVRWSRHSGTTQGKMLIKNINCFGLAMDEERNLYVSNYKKHEVRRYEIDRGDNIGIVVAGGNGNGIGLNHLNEPRYLFVDRNQSLYISDYHNHRVMKWGKGAQEGVVVAGGRGRGSALTQLSYPNGIYVDSLGTLYVAEGENNRVTRWSQGSEKEVMVVVGGQGRGRGKTQLNRPFGLSFDKHGNLYVVDHGNHRVQRFKLKQKNSLPKLGMNRAWRVHEMKWH